MGHTRAGVLALACAAACALAVPRTPAQQEDRLTMAAVMTDEELRATGVASLSPSQRKALDQWLDRYTGRVAKALVPHGSRSDCVPAIEGQIQGDFNGWEGETIFKLTNGQIWEQAEYDYDYEYDFMPEVTIYSTTAGCRMKVEGVDETILVRRIR